MSYKEVHKQVVRMKQRMIVEVMADMGECTIKQITKAVNERNYLALTVHDISPVLTPLCNKG